jgi:hypothetical protein
VELVRAENNQLAERIFVLEQAVALLHHDLMNIVSRSR